ncbi:cytochrome P450 [Artomyces pyxidatus]|uniref:Cytochrome P450 n=1 Tax=Artomyces pyxidatus TaxID=48021 RepID=A0ACB8SLY2_9AGAM|nr:cytochrome P450 [Artomyces pyxidatus]
MGTTSFNILSAQRDRSLPALIFLLSLACLCLGASKLVYSLVYQRIKQVPLCRTVPGPHSDSVFTGNLGRMFGPRGGEFHEYIHKTYGDVVRITGLVGESLLVVSDTRALNSILMKEQEVFEEQEWYTETLRHIFGPGLLSATGSTHRRQRKILGPVFSTKHISAMMPVFHRVARQLTNTLRAQIPNDAQEIEMLNWLRRSALELVAQAGLGYTFDSLNPDAKKHAFSSAIQEFVPTIVGLGLLGLLFPLISRWPPRILRLAAPFVPFPIVRNAIRITNVLHTHAKGVFDVKKAALERGDDEFTGEVGEGRDIISIVMRENAKADGADQLPDDEIIAQMSTLLFAGTDTTSTALARALYLLSQHQDIQDKLRQELNDAHAAAGGTDLSYDALVDLPYLDALCRETLRLYPPTSLITRTCVADKSVPLTKPLTTSQGTVSSVVVPSGTTILISIIGVNRDPCIWGADVDEWKPERWLNALPESVGEAHVPGVYSNMMTFLGGGRSCIGFRFSQLEMKVVIYHLIRSFRLSPSRADIVWRFGGTTTPWVEGSSAGGPQMPIILERL